MGVSEDVGWRAVRSSGGGRVAGVVSRPRFVLVVLGVLTVLGLVLRAAGLDQSLFGDELFAYDHLHGHDLGGVLHAVVTRNTPIPEVTPPLFFVLAWAAEHVGGDFVTTIRLPSLVLGTALIPLVYVLGARLFGRPSGLMASAITTLSPFAIFYSQEARPYATLALLAGLSTLCLLSALDTHRALWWVAYALSLAAVAYTHYTGIFVLAAQTLWALWYHRTRWRPLLTATVGATVLYLPWLPHLGAGKELEFYGPFSLVPAVHQYARVLPGHPFAPLPGTPALAAFLLVVASALVLAIQRAVRRRAEGRPLMSPGAALVLALLFATPLGLLVYSVATDHFLLLARNYSASFPALVAALAAALTAPQARIAAMLSALALASLAVGTLKALTPDYRRPAFSDIAAFIDARARPRDAVFDGGFGESLPYHAVRIYLKRRYHLFPISGVKDMWAYGARTHSSVFLAVPAALDAHLDRPGLVPSSFRLVARREFRGFVPYEVREYAPVGTPLITATPGFAPEERNARASWRWAIAPHAALHLTNPSREQRRDTVKMTLRPAPGARAVVNVRYPDGSASPVEPSAAGTQLRRTFHLAIGGGSIAFYIRAAPVHVADDPRTLYLQVQDLRVDASGH